MKKLIFFSIIVVVAILTFLLGHAIYTLFGAGIETSEKSECLKWEDQYSNVSHISEIYDLPDWQKTQCEQYGIDLERFFE